MLPLRHCYGWPLLILSICDALEIIVFCLFSDRCTTHIQTHSNTLCKFTGHKNSNNFKYHKWKGEKKGVKSSPSYKWRNIHSVEWEYKKFLRGLLRFYADFNAIVRLFSNTYVHINKNMSILCLTFQHCIEFGCGCLCLEHKTM